MERSGIPCIRGTSEVFQIRICQVQLPRSGSHHRSIACHIDDADTVLGVARGSRGLEDGEQCFRE